LPFLTTKSYVMIAFPSERANTLESRACALRRCGALSAGWFHLTNHEPWS
jgi:hypothetical protein